VKIRSTIMLAYLAAQLIAEIKKLLPLVPKLEKGKKEEEKKKDDA
jgi:hypothetical protein